MSFLSLICGYLFLPELKNRSLEEVDKMFESKLPLRKFGKYEQLDGVGSVITKLEQGEDEEDAIRKGGPSVVENDENGGSRRE